MPPAMMDALIEKSHKIKITITPAPARGRGHVEHAFCVYVLDCRRSKPRRYSSQSLIHPQFLRDNFIPIRVWSAAATVRMSAAPWRFKNLWL